VTTSSRFSYLDQRIGILVNYILLLDFIVVWS